MSKKNPKIIDRDKRLKEISEKIKACDAYLQMDVDPMAKKRVEALTKNPCASGTFYLNAVYKDDFLCSDEEAEIYAKKYRRIRIETIPYTEFAMNQLYNLTDNGLFHKDTIEFDIGPAEAPYTEKTTYIDFQYLLDYKAEEIETELEQENSSDIENFPDGGNIKGPYKIFDKYLDPIYNGFMVSTVKLAKSLDGSVKYLENGVEGVYKCKKLLNFSAFQQFCDNQKRILDEQSQTDGLLR